MELEEPVLCDYKLSINLLGYVGSIYHKTKKLGNCQNHFLFKRCQ